MRTCKSCGATIVWAVTEKGKKIPVDAAPVAGGNLKLVFGGVDKPVVAVVVPVSELVTQYVSHFATCPNASRHRRQRTYSEGGPEELCNG